MPNDNQKPTDNNQQQTGSLPPVPTDDMSPLVVEDTTPPMLNDNDLPLATTPSAVIADEKPVETNSGSAAPSDDVVMAPIVTTQKKKFAGGKVIATILGLFLLVGGLGAGTYLVQQNQDIREKAGSCGGGCGPGYVCDGNGGCEPKSGNGDTIAPNTNPYTWDEWQQDEHEKAEGFTATNTCTLPDSLKSLCVVGVAQLSKAPNLPEGYTLWCDPDPTKDGRCSVQKGGVTVGEYKISGSGGGEDTPPGDNPTPTQPSITAVCQNVKAYSSTWALLTNAQLAQLNAGDSVNFCVTGVATGGSFDKAKFTINGMVQAETTTVRPSSTDFCQSYVIPAGITTFNVTAQINHVTLGWK